MKGQKDERQTGKRAKGRQVDRQTGRQVDRPKGRKARKFESSTGRQARRWGECRKGEVGMHPPYLDAVLAHCWFQCTAHPRASSYNTGSYKRK